MSGVYCKSIPHTTYVDTHEVTYLASSVPVERREKGVRLHLLGSPALTT